MSKVGRVFQKMLLIGVNLSNRASLFLVVIVSLVITLICGVSWYQKNQSIKESVFISMIVAAILLSVILLEYCPWLVARKHN